MVVSFGSLIAVGTIFLLFQSTDAFAQTGHRIPFNQIHDEIPPKRVSPPPCPDVSGNPVCYAAGSSSHSFLATANGEAIAECAADYTSCILSIDEVIAERKTECEAVAGCKLSYQLVNKPCSQSPSRNCKAGKKGPFLTGTWTCISIGSVSAKNIECKRP